VQWEYVIDMMDMTFGTGHYFKTFTKESIPDLKAYLPQGMATLASYGGEKGNGYDEWGHYFIVFHALNDNLYAIDSQQNTVTLLHDFLDVDFVQWYGFSVLIEPATGVKQRAYITKDIVDKMLVKMYTKEQTYIDEFLEEFDKAERESTK
jgi:hypothetical protein